MNLSYLRQLLKTRKQEIKDGKNLSTRQPIYVVLDLREHITNGHSDYSLCTNLKGIDKEHGYIDQGCYDWENIEFLQDDEGMIDPQEVTRFYTDIVVSFFITESGAKEYLKYQKHNLLNGYMYVFYSGYGNREMNKLLQNG